MRLMDGQCVFLSCPIPTTQCTTTLILTTQQNTTNITTGFKELAESPDHRAPSGSKRGADAGADDLHERAFWSGVTINPPLYGADTPQSFFDERLDYGWNLRALDGCLLRQKGVPHIPGVTAPMTYFGMWKSFFSWHLEDADLFSINYLHFGAPKVWYCVAPSQKAKFERMAQSLYPELHRGCRAFLRHKDVMLSPQMLRTYGVEYTMAKQEANEFVVLNAAAYHAGYNLGFNCAEAVNFAMREWIEAGRCQTRCKCDALKDGVRISMRHFGYSDTSESEEEEESEEESGSGSEAEEESGSGSEESAEEEEEEESAEESEEEQQQQARKRSGGKAAVAPAAKRQKAAAGAQQRRDLTPLTADATAAGRTPAEEVAAGLGAAKARAAALRAAHAARRARYAKQQQQQQQRAAGGKQQHKQHKQQQQQQQPAKGPPPGPAPQAIVGQAAGGKRFFYLVQVVPGAPARAGFKTMRWLREGKDGVFRPAKETWQERADALVDVRTQWVGAKASAGGSGNGNISGGWKLLTLRSRILDTELLD